MRRDDFEVRVEFLRARLREDEAAARALKIGKDEGVVKLQARVLADVEAKRRLMEWVEEYPRKAEGNGERTRWQKVAGDMVADWSRDHRSPVIYELVEAYDGHPDFRPEWRSEDGQEPREDHEVGARSRRRTI